MIETRVDGRPADLRAAAAYLTDALGHGVDQLSDRVNRERAAARDGWRGDAADAFADRASTLTCAGDSVALGARSIGRQLETLASVLETVQAAMVDVRAEARAAGLDVAGTVIHPPAIGASFGNAALTDGPLPIVAYGTARDRTAELLGTWNDALSGAAGTLDSQRLTIASITRDLLAAGYDGWWTHRLSPILRGQADFLAGEARRAREELTELVSGLREGRVQPYAGVYDDLDELPRTASTAEDGAARYLHTADRFVAANAVLEASGYAFALYGIYDDLQNGESPEQAVVSQTTSFAIGAFTGARTGALVGSGFPVVGTVAGATVGAAVGFATNWAIDRRYDRARERAERTEEEERTQERRRDQQRVRDLFALAEGRATPTERMPVLEDTSDD